jgi:hypothetical protein
VNDSFSSPKWQIMPLIEIAEHSLTVLQLAELDLQWANPFEPARSVLAWMRRNEFDAAPVIDSDPYSYIGAEWLEPDGRPVKEHARPIDSSTLVSADLGLADGISRLMSRPYYFVLKGDRLCGIVTRADLQRPTVNMVLFSLILAAESAVKVIILDYLGPSWFDHLGAERQEKARDIYDLRVKDNAQVTLLECLMISDRLHLLSKCQPVLSALGFSSKKQFNKWKEQITEVRDNLAHGGTLLHAESDPVRAIQLFEDIRSFAQRIWDVTQDRPALARTGSMNSEIRD